MSTKQQFGGEWTIEKLGILSDYLDFYVKALKNQSFDLIYIDAFAGTGRIKIGNEDEYIEIDGSAKLSLSTVESFDYYYFIEKKKSYARELEQLITTEFSNKKDKVDIINKDCNLALVELCERINWKKTRAVLFLDPYATEVTWETLQVIADTKAIDVWYLFPYSAANRLMKKNGEIDELWRKKLNSIFGTDSWEEKFYFEDPQMNFLDDTVTKVKNANQDSLKQYIEEQLKTVFPYVSNKSRFLYNKNNSPLFLFCFAVSNDNRKAYGLASKVANYILNSK